MVLLLMIIIQLLLPMGTCYFSESQSFWNIYDQVMMSRSLIKHFKKDELKIVTKIGDESLECENNKPDKKKFSDHFPLVFEFAEI